MTAGRAIRVWVAFAVVHAILIGENLIAPNGPLGDVLVTYPAWWSAALLSGDFPGLTSSGVYPWLALVPIAVAADGVVAWFTMVLALDAIAVAFLARRSVIAVYVWLAFQLALGPIALGRIDAVTVALGVLAVTLSDTAPRFAGVLVALGTWIKVWPIAIGVAAIRLPRFATVARWAIGVAVGILAFGVAVGDRFSVFSFLTEQQGRGLQVESVAATPWLWDAWARGGSTIAYSTEILTFEVSGSGTGTAAALLTVAQTLVLASVVALVLSHRRTVSSISPVSFGYALLAVVSLLITLNKVGSPQFVSWLAVPLVALILVSGNRTPTSVVALIGSVAVLTHIVYPYVYFAFLELRTMPLVVLTVRNIAEVALAVTSLVLLMRQLRVEKLAQQFADLGISDEKRVVTER